MKEEEYRNVKYILEAKNKRKTFWKWNQEGNSHDNNYK